jgi:hypothetical protein
MKTIIDQIEVVRNGTLQIRMRKILTVNGVDHDLGFHRTVVEPGADVDQQFALVNKHLKEMGFGPVDAPELARVKALVPVVHTPEVVAEHRKRQQ